MERKSLTPGFSLSAPLTPALRLEEGPSTTKETYQHAKQDGSHATYQDSNIADREGVEEVYNVDSNAGIHGNWMLENAQYRLDIFLRVNQINALHKCSSDGRRKTSYIWKTEFFVEKLDRNISAIKWGLTQEAASQRCALSLVRQLFHLGFIEAFEGLPKKISPIAQIPAYKIQVDPKLVREIEIILLELGVQPRNLEIGRTDPKAVSILKSTAFNALEISEFREAGVVRWDPPISNWNTWSSCNIDKGPFASVTMDEISDNLEKDLKDRMKNDPSLQQSIENRKKLSIHLIKDEILNAITLNRVIIIKGSTGCGKTTQVCQYILDEYILKGRGACCNIIVTQPYGISAISVAERISLERQEDLGVSVGYSIRFKSTFPRPYGSVLFCTVDVLLRKLEGGLRGISHVIVDEVHKRDVNTDFILVVLRDMIHKYPNLRVILMSAIIDESMFSKYFKDCPVIEVLNQTFPVKTYFLKDIVKLVNFEASVDPKKPENNSEKFDEDEIYDGVEGDETVEQVEPSIYSKKTRNIVQTLIENDENFEFVEAILKYIKDSGVSGAVLFFLPGWDVIGALRYRLSQHPIFGNEEEYSILPLHSRFPRQIQGSVIEQVPPNVTKIILSPNMAESSIITDDVVFVIDFCKIRMKIFTAHNNLIIRSTVWASRSDLHQRKSLAGRVRGGFCFRLITKARYKQLDEHKTAGMFHRSLHKISLAIKLLRLGTIREFLGKAIEPPPIDAVIEAVAILRGMGCLDSNDELTPLGRTLARLPIEPRLGKMMILSTMFGLGDAIATITANISTFPDIFRWDPISGLSPMQQWFAGNYNSDHIAMLRAYYKWSHILPSEGDTRKKTFCEERNISMNTMNVISDAKKELKDFLIDAGFTEGSMSNQLLKFRKEDNNLDMVAALLCMGLSPNICYYTGNNKAFTMECERGLICKSSVIYKAYEGKIRSPFFIFGEKVFRTEYKSVPIHKSKVNYNAWGREFPLLSCVSSNKIKARTVLCKHLTMITPIHLLLFGCREAVLIRNGIRLDNWLELNMDLNSASAMVALRTVIEGLIVKAVNDPKSVENMSPIDQKVLGVIKELCRFNAGLHGLEKMNMNTLSTQYQSRPPDKRTPPFHDSWATPPPVDVMNVPGQQRPFVKPNNETPYFEDFRSNPPPVGVIGGGSFIEDRSYNSSRFHGGNFNSNGNFHVFYEQQSGYPYFNYSWTNPPPVGVMNVSGQQRPFVKPNNETPYFEDFRSNPPPVGVIEGGSFIEDRSYNSSRFHGGNFNSNGNCDVFYEQQSGYPYFNYSWTNPPPVGVMNVSGQQRPFVKPNNETPYFEDFRSNPPPVGVIEGGSFIEDRSYNSSRFHGGNFNSNGNCDVFYEQQSGIPYFNYSWTNPPPMGVMNVSGQQRPFVEPNNETPYFEDFLSNPPPVGVTGSGSTGEDLIFGFHHGNFYPNGNCGVFYGGGSDYGRGGCQSYRGQYYRGRYGGGQ